MSDHNDLRPSTDAERRSSRLGDLFYSARRAVEEDVEKFVEAAVARERERCAKAAKARWNMESLAVEEDSEISSRGLGLIEKIIDDIQKGAP